ncbi:MAG: hypothetical protein ACYTDU_01025 [Planctomycetota bacterium]|jgi:hypothetical protein
MPRPCLLALTLLCVAACNGDRDATTIVDPGKSATVAKPAPESPTTGISQIQKMHDELKEDLTEQEERVKRGQPAEQRLVRGQLTGIDILIESTELAIVQDTLRMLRREHGLLRQKESKIIRARNENYAEVAEMETILANHANGLGSIPAGFSEAELKDRVGDFKEAVRKLEKEWEEVRAEMKKKEELLKLDVIPPQGETLFTKELAELKLTRLRVEALQK